MRSQSGRAKRCEGNGGGERPGEEAKEDRHGDGIACLTAGFYADAKPSRALVKARRLWLTPNLATLGLQKFPHAHAMHETLADLHGIAAGGSGTGFVVDADADQRWARRQHRLIDQSFEIFLIRGPS